MSVMNPIEEVSLEGFQIVASEMFIHLPRKSDATCSLWPTKLSFSKLVLSALNNCEFVRIEVNPKTKCLIVLPVPSSDKNYRAVGRLVSANQKVMMLFDFSNAESWKTKKEG